MITHYGLFWSEKDVFWGRQKNSGAMLGKTSAVLDTPGAPRINEQNTPENFGDYIGVYCLFRDGELIYAGQAGVKEWNGKKTKQTIFKRLRSHKTGPLANSWDSFSWFGRKSNEDEIDNVDAHLALTQLEAIIIAVVNPGSNKQSGAFKDATQVYQVRHPKLEDDVFTKVKSIEKDIKTIIDTISKLNISQQITLPNTAETKKSKSNSNK